MYAHILLQVREGLFEELRCVLLHVDGVVGSLDGGRVEEEGRDLVVLH